MKLIKILAISLLILSLWIPTVKYIKVKTIEAQHENLDNQASFMWEYLHSCKTEGYFKIKQHTFMCVYLGKYN